MMMRKITKIVFKTEDFMLMVVVLLLQFFIPAAHACYVGHPLTEDLKKKADLVFIGEAVAYTPEKETNSKDPVGKPTIIKFKVEKVISGPQQSEVEAYWINATYSESKNLEEFQREYGKRIRVGITKKRLLFEKKGPSDRPWILQGICTPPYIFKEK